MLHEVSSFCRAFKGYRVHCRDTQTFPVVHRRALVSYISVPDSMARHKKLLNAPKHLISLNPIFLGHPVYGFGVFVKRNIIVVSLRTQVLVKNFRR